jgi:hypothetical protein
MAMWTGARVWSLRALSRLFTHEQRMMYEWQYLKGAALLQAALMAAVRQGFFISAASSSDMGGETSTAIARHNL